MKAIDPRRTTLGLPTLSVRAIKLVLALIAGVTGVGGYCAGFSGSAAPAAERQEEILDEAANLDAILREIDREDSNRIGVDKKKALKGAINFFRPFPGGNGRSCATCHNPRDGFSLSPATV